MINQTPPHNLEAEKYVLGAILRDNACIVELCDMLDKTDFYHIRHEIIFNKIMEIYNQGSAIDIIILVEALTAAGDIKKVGGTAYISGLIDNIVTSQYVTYYAKIIKDKSIQRKVINLCQTTQNEAYGVEDVNAWSGMVSSRFVDLGASQGFSGPKTGADVFLETIDSVGKPDPVVSSGMDILDTYLAGGFRPGDYIILAARPSMGKTAIALWWMLDMIIHNKKILLCSLEMTSREIMLRLISADTGIPLSRIRNMRKKQTLELEKSSVNLYKRNYYIEDYSNRRTSKTPNYVRSIATKTGVDLVVVDHIGLMYPDIKKDEARNMTRNDQVKKISGQLKSIGKQLGIPMIIVSQLNRGLHQRMSNQPALADLRDSGALEEDADMVIMLHRPGYFERGIKSDERQHIDEEMLVMIQKNRNGMTGAFNIYFDMKTQSFNNWNENDGINGTRGTY